MDAGLQVGGSGHGGRSAISLLLLATGQALETLLLRGEPTLVLEEDGTAVESEDFFQLLEDDTCLMVLDSGQSWSPVRVRPWLGLLKSSPLTASHADLDSGRAVALSRTAQSGRTVQARWA